MATARPVSLATASGPKGVRPGTVDDAAVYAYKNGQCIALALAINRRTGWPIVVHVSRAGSPDWERRMHGHVIPLARAGDGWFRDFVHAMVLTPTDQLLDIDDLHDPDAYREAACDTYGSSALVTIFDGQVLRAALAWAWKNGAKRIVQDETVAAAFAEVLIRDYHASARRAR